jgi:hypothetical protein
MAKMIIKQDGVEREATAEEIAQHEIDQVEIAKENAARQERIDVKKAIFDKLGLTEDEARLLLS